MDELKTILCPVDFSAASQLAARKAAVLARALSAKLLLLHVIDLHVPAGLGLVGLEPAQVLVEHERNTRERMDALRRELAQQHDIPVDVWITAGSVYEIILRAAVERSACLIVMGRGRPGMLGIMGSVADRVTRKAPCPTIVCPKLSDAVASQEHAG